MKNSIELYRKRLERALSKQPNAWSSGEDVGCAVEWDPKPMVLFAENALNARYQILGVRTGDHSHNLKIALRIVVWPKSGDRATAVRWFHDPRFKEKLAEVSNPLLPISIGWRVVYATRQPTTGVDSIIDIARLGSWVLGERFLGESVMINEIMNIVEGLNPKESDWQQKLRLELEKLFTVPYEDGQVVTAQHLNEICNRLTKIEKVLYEADLRIKILETPKTDLKSQIPPKEPFGSGTGQ